MSSNQSKLGFVRVQQGASDFALAVSRFDAATRAAAERNKSEAKTERVADDQFDAADHLLGVPAPDVAGMVHKLDAYAVAFSTGRRLTDPDHQRYIMERGQNDLKGLLAISLDLQALAQAPVQPAISREAFDAALADYRAAEAHEAALRANPPEGDDGPWEEADDRRIDAYAALMAAPAPDLAALLVQAREGVWIGYCDELGDSPENPTTLARILASGLDAGQVAVRLYQSILRLCGGSPLCDVQPFDADRWIRDYERAGGSFLITPDGAARMGDICDSEGGDISVAMTLLNDLSARPQWARDAVLVEVARRAQRRAQDDEA